MYKFSGISFPTLGIELDPPRSFAVGPLNIHLYGIIIACGLLLAVLYGYRRSKEFGFTQDDIIDGVLWVTPFAIDYTLLSKFYSFNLWHFVLEI